MDDATLERRHRYRTTLRELERALAIADRQITRGRPTEARRALGTCEAIARSLDAYAPTDGHHPARLPGNVIPLHAPTPGPDRQKLAPIQNGHNVIGLGIIPRVIDRLHMRRRRGRDVDSTVPSVAECIDEWVRWQA